MQTKEPCSAHRITLLKVPPLEHLLLGSLDSGLGDLTSLVNLSNRLGAKLVKTRFLNQKK
jgi:hypothetical protein